MAWAFVGEPLSRRPAVARRERVVLDARRGVYFVIGGAQAGFSRFLPSGMRVASRIWSKPGVELHGSVAIVVEAGGLRCDVRLPTGDLKPR